MTSSSEERPSAEAGGSRLPHREVTDGLLRPPPSAIQRCPRAESRLLRGFGLACRSPPGQYSITSHWCWLVSHHLDTRSTFGCSRPTNKRVHPCRECATVAGAGVGASVRVWVPVRVRVRVQVRVPVRVRVRMWVPVRVWVLERVHSV